MFVYFRCSPILWYLTVIYFLVVNERIETKWMFYSNDIVLCSQMFECMRMIV